MTRFPFKMMGCIGGLTLVALLVLGCVEAEDLGGEDPDETIIAADQPSWEVGIDRIIATKCALCHNNNPEKFVPFNIPDNLDLTHYQGDGVTFRGAREIVPFLLAGLLESDLDAFDTRQMPLEYSTPLTDSESFNLLFWAELGGPLNPSTTGSGSDCGLTNPTAEADGEFVFENPQNAGASACRLCHSRSHYSTLSGAALLTKVVQMYEILASNGAGSWASQSFQTELLFYVADC